MAKNNTEGQAKRSKIGTDFQRKVCDIFETWLETEHLDSIFEVKNLGRKDSALSNGKSISPDGIVVKKATGTIQIRIGVKSSMRERWKQDDRDAILCDLCGPSVPWIEITECEYSNSSLSDIRKKCSEVKAASNFTFVVSLLDRDGMNAMRNNLKKFLIDGAL